MASEVNLKGEEKAAVVLLSLDKKSAASILKHLDESEIQKITYHIARNNKVSSEERESIIEEFHEQCLAQGYISSGGMEYAKEVLTEALGAQKSLELMNSMSDLIKAEPFSFLKDVDSNEILNILRYERNQTVALILSYMNPEQSAMVLSAFEPERQIDIIKRTAQMDKISPEIVSQVEEEVKKKLNNFVSSNHYTDTVGIDIVADIMTSIDRSAEQKIFEQLEKENKEMAEEIRKKMFVFEDIVHIDQKSLQLVLSKIENNELAMALKAAGDEVKDVVLKNISQRVKDNILEEMDMLGKVRLSEVQEAQQKIVSMILDMEKEGTVVILKGGGEQLVG